MTQQTLFDANFNFTKYSTFDPNFLHLLKYSARKRNANSKTFITI